MFDFSAWPSTVCGMVWCLEKLCKTGFLPGVAVGWKLASQQKKETQLLTYVAISYTTAYTLKSNVGVSKITSLKIATPITTNH